MTRSNRKRSGVASAPPDQKKLTRLTHYREPRGAKDNEPVDELVAFDAYVHLEAMNDSQYSLIVDSRELGHVCLMIGPLHGKRHVRARVFWREPSCAV